VKSFALRVPQTDRWNRRSVFITSHLTTWQYFDILFRKLYNPSCVVPTMSIGVLEKRSLLAWNYITCDFFKTDVPNAISVHFWGFRKPNWFQNNDYPVRYTSGTILVIKIRLFIISDNMFTFYVTSCFEIVLTEFNS